MTDKDPREAVTSYITDMLALEQHISKALEGQIQDLKTYPELTGEIRGVLGSIVQPEPGPERVGRLRPCRGLLHGLAGPAQGRLNFSKTADRSAGGSAQRSITPGNG